MKKYSVVLSLLILIGAVYWSFEALMPQNYSKADTPKNEFSTERALTHVKAISQKPHYVGSEAHKTVREYIVSELQKTGLKTEIQEGYTSGDWANLSKAINIITKIEGTGNGKALLLLTHYDSSPHSSLGASDAGSGVATILEGIRAFLSQVKKPENDIIIVFTDAEELGLNGAQLFVNEHRWTQNIGLVLNFEARGSGGPGVMLVETNGGNSKLIKHFAEANPKYPMGNSLAYSVYKMMPNDTDLTVFREDANIEGFNFAFIDDHFDYHTVMDNYERLDRNTLEHQGSYLMPLLHYFSKADLTDLKSDEDYVFVNVPVFKLINYPFSWIIPMLVIAWLVFIVLFLFGILKREIGMMEVFKGFIPFLLSLIVCGIIGFYGWPFLKVLYPGYNDNLHGFTYNGYQYLAVFTFLSLAICFSFYNKFKEIKTINLIIAPLTIWLIICTLVAVYLEGASFFILPAFAGLASFYILINQSKPNLILLTLLTFPAIWILSPLVQMFPVGLGLKMMVAATLLTVLIFGLLTPVLGFYKRKGKLALLAIVIAFGYFIAAHVESNYTPDKPKPNSLLYVYDADTGKAHWATYDTSIDPWVSQYMGDNKQEPHQKDKFSSKYNTGFSFISDATFKEIKQPEIEIGSDTIVNGKRHVEVCINSKRNINRLEVFTSTKNIEQLEVNGIPFSEEYLEKREHKLFNHQVSNNMYTDIELVLPENEKMELTIYEISNDLLSNSHFSIPPRPRNTIPMPFVVNDAVLVKKTFKL